MRRFALSIILGSIASMAFSLHRPVHLRDTQGNRHQTEHQPATIKIKAFYVNVEGSKMRATCMEEQLQHHRDTLARMGILLDFQRWPAVTFKTCQTVEECMKEKPECFPSRKAGQLVHPKFRTDENEVHMLRGVIGNWCAHLKNLDAMSREANKYHYFMVFEDDVVLLDTFPATLQDLLSGNPPLWTLTAFDTFDNYKVPSKVPEDAIKSSAMRLMSISGKKGEYWGGHAWILSAARLDLFREWYKTLPAIPLDWVPKAPSPLHLGMLSYNARAAIQKRFLTDKEESSMSLSCRSQSESDIRRDTSLLTQTESEVVHHTSNSATPREIVILGMYDTGTNMMMRLIKDNLEKPNHAELCQNYSAWAYCGAVWKHTHPSRLSEFPRQFPDARPKGSTDFKKAVAVVMIRHPFSLMRSLQAASYDMECSFTVQKEWLREPCRYVTPNGTALKNQLGMPRLDQPTCPHRKGVCWESLVSAWNSYTDGYLRDLPNLFHDTIYVRYEDMLENPAAVLADIAQRVGVAAPRSVHVPSQGLKVVNGIRSRDLAGALGKLHAKAYDSNYSAVEINDLCSQLDKSLLFSMGYHGCQVEDTRFLEVTFEMPGRA